MAKSGSAENCVPWCWWLPGISSVSQILFQVSDPPAIEISVLQTWLHLLHFSVKVIYVSIWIIFLDFSSNTHSVPAVKACRGGRMHELWSLFSHWEKVRYLSNHSHKIRLDFQNKAHLIGNDFSNPVSSKWFFQWQNKDLPERSCFTVSVREKGILLQENQRIVSRPKGKPVEKVWQVLKTSKLFF